MLTEIRSREAATPHSPVVPRRVFGDRSAAISAALVVALLVLVGLIVMAGVLFAAKRRTTSETAIPVATHDRPFIIDGGDGSRVEITGDGIKVQESRSEVVAPPQPPPTTVR